MTSPAAPDTTATAADASTTTRLAVAGVLVTIVLVAACLRPAVTSVGPVAARIGAELGFGPAAIGLLSALPLVCFGLFAFVAHGPARRFGLERVLAVAMGVLAIGTALRLLPDVPPLWIGTALAGVGIAVANVLLPAVVKRSFPEAIALFAGVQTTVMGTSAGLGSGLSVPIADATGSWRLAIAASLPVAVAATVWLVARLVTERGVRRRARPVPAPAVAPSPAAPPRAESRMIASPTAWLVTAYMGLQSMHFYVTIAWLPSIEQAAGTSAADAGWHLSASIIIGMIVGIGVAFLLGRSPDQRFMAAFPAVPVLAACIGLAVAPAPLGLLWAALLGVGQTMSLILAITLIGLRSADAHDASKLSAMAQGLGFLLAAVGPVAAGALRELSGSWLAVIAVIAVAVVAQAIAGLGAGRPVTIGGGHVVPASA